MTTQPEALRLADELEKDRWHITGVTAHEAAAELRRLHDEVEALRTDAEKTYRKTMMQLFTDPENQPSQYGTVTVEYMEREIEAKTRRLHDLLGKANALCRIRHEIIQAREDECLTHSSAFYEATRLLSEAKEQRDALLESMRWIAEVNATDYEYQAKARAAIAKAEEA